MLMSVAFMMVARGANGKRTFAVLMLVARATMRGNLMYQAGEPGSMDCKKKYQQNFEHFFHFV